MHEHPESKSQSAEIELIIGNSNSNFSGVTSTMLQVMSYQKQLINLRIMGKHFVPDPELVIGFWDTVKLCRKPLKNGKWRIFHARRVDEMIQGVLLKYVFGAKIRLVFSSAAQRKRSGSTVWLTNKMDAIIAVSKRSASFLHLPPNMINPHGVQVDNYTPAADKQAAWQALGYGGKFGIGILGRVRKQKGVHLFVEACIQNLPQHPDINAVVVGAISGSSQGFVDELKQKIAQAGLSDRIIFTGELPFEQIPPIFSALSMVCALSDNEGFGLTVLEAMSCRAAVLATEAGAWEEIIRPGVDGYVVPVNDQQAVSEKMALMLSDRNKLVEMGIAGRSRVEDNYRVEDEAKKLVDYFRTLQ
ncbi:glycosyltransferase family 4 protein [Paraglaciecola aquimarina]|uniref:Glycosyltransferase family 4 protein n=1 Tax=Paraglaciecola aquimarina TaxID=1235557 RepID=A0ABU3STW8_9ALTE|nr:glycosyltransferase family 4 protein [Paraglaciecola aquimarina]MDU0353459.1 glycosyltransferase family 4 protein [Paraglaciecola aquimarina]